MFLRTTAFILIAGFAQLAMADGFVGGDSFQTAFLSGTMSLQCDDAGTISTTQYFCHQGVLDPGEFAYFQSASGAAADEVVLTATHEDQTTQRQILGFDAKKGRSRFPFNLWISSLTQTPLLKNGVNAIHFSLVAHGKEIYTGDFTATVTVGTDRQCHFGMVTSHWGGDCLAPQNMCLTYFEQENYCQ